MAKKWLVSAAYAASAVAMVALTGCGGGAPDDGYGGPGASSYEQSEGSGELLGGTPAPVDDSGLVGGPRDFTGMDPIPNPENLPLALRQQIYGHKFDHLKYRPLPGEKIVVEADVHPGAALRSWRKADGTLVVAMRPIANPEDMSPAERLRVYGKRYAPRANSAPRHGRSWLQPKVRLKPAPKPVYSAPAKPAPVKPKVAVAPPAPKPAPRPAPVVAAPVIKPIAVAPVIKAPPVAAKPAPVDPKMAQISAAVGPEVIKGAVLTVPDSLAKGEESKVNLSLPVNLLDLIRKEAGKLGLTREARKAQVSATLTGEGYTITPNAAQTQTLESGEAASFDWNVKPGDGEKTPLKATVNGALTGGKGAAKTFSLATLEQAIARTVDTAQSQAKKWGLPSLDKISLPGLKPIKVGGTTITPGQTTAGIIVFILALILLAMARAGAGRRARAERRRKFRTMTDYGRADEDAPETPSEAHQEHHVSHAVHPAATPAPAAAVAAAPIVEDHPAEPAAMTFAPSEDEAHGHADEAHAPEAHAPEAHATEAQAHAEHAHEAHSEDAHVKTAEAHPEAPAADAHAPDHGHAEDHAHAEADAPADDDHHHRREPEHA